jgi:hypothetical protein
VPWTKGAAKAGKLASSRLMDFTRGQASFTCSTQLAHYQRVHFFGTKGRIEIEIPFNASPDRPTRIVIDTVGDLSGKSIVIEEFPAKDQYTLQGDAFSLAILENTGSPGPPRTSDRQHGGH